MAYGAGPFTPGDAERTVDVRIADKSGVFGGFYRPFVDECAQRLQHWSEQGEEGRAPAVDLSRVAHSVLGSVLDALSWIGVRTLITAFHAARADEDPRPGYAEFHQRVGSEEGRRSLTESFPELNRLLRLVARQRMDQVETLLQAVWEDRDLLSERFGTAGPVVSVQPGAGDSHRGGQTVCCVTWENGVTLVYKPQTGSTHGLLEAVRSAVDPAGDFFGPLCPDTVERPRHLWQETARYSELPDRDRAPLYFRRFGRCAALLGMFGAGDLHHENIIATAEGPMVIDLETLISLPNPAVLGEGWELAADIEESILSTLLFPARYPSEVIDVDVSALGSVRTDHSRRLDTFLVVDTGTDDIRFDSVPVGALPGDNLARVGGEQLDPREWPEELVAGFTEARERLREARDLILETVRKSDGWAIRQLIRPSFIYSRFLEASTHPAYLGDRSDRFALFDKLPRHYRGLKRSVAEEVCAEEAAALLDLDIPFFEVECDSRTLQCNGGREEVPNAVVASPREAGLDRIEGFFRRPAERDPAYIRYALDTSVDDVWESSAAHRSGPGARVRPYALTDPRELAETAQHLCLGGPQRPTWLMPRVAGEGMRLDAVNAVLYEGGGLLLHLARLQAQGLADGVDIAAVLATAAPKDLPSAAAPIGLSPFTGNLSNRVTALELAGVSAADPADAPAVHVDTDRMPAAADLSAADLDYLNGFGGYLVYLAEYEDPEGPRPVGLEAEALVRRLVEVDGTPGEHDGEELGLAHGRFGRMAALSAGVDAGADPGGRARDHLEAFADAYLRHRWRDDVLASPADAAGWCKGYAGVAFAATKVLGALGRTPGDIREAVAPEVEHIAEGPLSGDISLCHGAAGRTAMLCWLAERLDWPQLRERARDLDTRFLERHAEGGWSCGVGSTASLLSFHLGLSGWHYSRLMLQDPAVRLPLCLGGR
ncbi:type 2 lanthipeptide synthetase LanM [Streptomonospora wellingtoniae]|uniref:Type 2 lanthipeptide synthetase LanM n=1 Tax=Streptomonospora wellingtoniae TaxID=3075544 RepID=A0ABU2KTR1_9ACTN|nr:type 2 lanthipeptide synthetase LanM [Streptomonospora sp. DSM 45055]MDT0302483.1 type 2 lanthipeptide synthetase LanM [Streptomonospora sp. DSM 45055]